MTVALLGGGGLLGTGFRSVLGDDGCTWVRVPWTEPERVAGAVRTELGPLLRAGRATTVVWAAGTGQVSASATAMGTEMVGLEALCEVVADLPADRRRGLRILLASSAGALFGGHGSSVVAARTPPSPVSDYGRAKLAQEQRVQALASDTDCRVVVARISNLYGLASGRVSRRGLVSTAVRATRLRQPMTVFVSPDVRRDYVYNRDAATLALRELDRAQEGLTTVLVTDGQTRTVAEVLGVVAKVSGRRVPAVYGERPETRLQPRVLRFAPPERGPSAVRRTPMEAAVHLMLRAPTTA